MHCNGFKALASRKIKRDASYHQPNRHEPVNADSPAIEVMTDLQQVAVATTTIYASIAAATQTMISHGVRLLLVLNAEGQIAGLITARDTMGERPIKYVHERGTKHSELTVRDCMTPIEEIDVLSMKDVMKTCVGNIVTTLEAIGRQHALVVDELDDGQEMLRGIFSITQIGRQLGVGLQAFEVAHTFADIRAALAPVAAG
ncbi:MAG: CBS domain-containing protein [Gammaproteobacteria bacterium]|nr:CBS domain-containing protein [Gammaproteobacteria bacterium]MBU1415778.1 CBS domain-containing protein [Gammaproteobacteria bacterium]